MVRVLRARRIWEPHRELPSHHSSDTHTDRHAAAAQPHPLSNRYAASNPHPISDGHPYGISDSDSVPLSHTVTNHSAGHSNPGALPLALPHTLTNHPAGHSNPSAHSLAHAGPIARHAYSNNATLDRHSNLIACNRYANSSRFTHTFPNVDRFTDRNPRFHRHTYLGAARNSFSDRDYHSHAANRNSHPCHSDRHAITDHHANRHPYLVSHRDRFPNSIRDRSGDIPDP